MEITAAFSDGIDALAHAPPGLAPLISKLPVFVS
jgi:hypothetical protein